MGCSSVKSVKVKGKAIVPQINQENERKTNEKSQEINTKENSGQVVSIHEVYNISDSKLGEEDSKVIEKNSNNDEDSKIAKENSNYGEKLPKKIDPDSEEIEINESNKTSEKKQQEIINNHHSENQVSRTGTEKVVDNWLTNVYQNIKTNI